MQMMPLYHDYSFIALDLCYIEDENPRSLWQNFFLCTYNKACGGESLLKDGHIFNWLFTKTGHMSKKILQNKHVTGKERK